MDLGGNFGDHTRPSLDSWGIQDIINNCVNLREFTPFRLESESEVLTLVEGITPNIRKLNLSFMIKVESQHVQILVERCKKLKELNLRRTHICALSIDYIVENSSEMKKLDLSQNDSILLEDLFKLNQLPTLRTLVIEVEKYSQKNVLKLKKMIPQVTEILEKPNHCYTLNIAYASKNYASEDGFWEIQAKQFPLFHWVVDKEAEEWQYWAINDISDDYSSDDFETNMGSDY